MPNQPKTPARAVRIPDELWRAVQDQAARQGETVTDVIRRALEQYVEDTSRCPACAGAMPAEQMGKPLQAAHVGHVAERTQR